jgi:hypothetical protein
VKHAIVLFALCLGGCAIGAGTSTVGIWRPQRVVDAQVCVRKQGTGCERIVDVGRDMPARSFGGGLFSWFNPGYLVMTSDGQAKHMFVMDSHYEYLRGRGGLALGGRIGANIAIGSQETSLFTLPLTAVGYWGYPRYSLYGGPGYTPYAVQKTGTDMSTNLHGFHVMGGGRALLNSTRSVRMTANIDVFHHRMLQGVTATSATFAIGLHF